MKKIKHIKKELLLSAFLFLAPFLTHGQGDVQGGFTIQNPLSSTDTLYGFLKKVLEVVIDIGFVVVVLFIVYAGFLFVTAQGSDEKISRAKRALLWAVVGGLILLGALVIAEAIEGTIESL